MNDDFSYDVQVTYVDGGMEVLTVQCRDASSPLTAIEKAIKLLRVKQRRTSVYRRAVGFSITSIVRNEEYTDPPMTPEQEAKFRALNGL